MLGQKFGRKYSTTGGPRELGQVLGELPLGGAPGEVRVRLREAELGEPVHHLRPRERLGEEDRRRGTRPRTSAISHSQNANGLVCGLSTRKIAHAVLASRTGRRRAARPTAPRQSARLEVERVDVLVLLRRVLGVLDACRRVGAGTTRGARAPTGGRASTGTRGRSRPRCRARARRRRAARSPRACRASGWTAVWPPSARRSPTGSPDRPGSLGGRVVRTLAARRGRSGGSAAGRARRSRGPATYGEPRGDVRERAVPPRLGRGRAREELVPGPEPGARRVDGHAQLARERPLLAPVGVRAHRLAQGLVEGDREGLLPAPRPQRPCHLLEPVRVPRPWPGGRRPGPARSRPGGRPRRRAVRPPSRAGRAATSRTGRSTRPRCTGGRRVPRSRTTRGTGRCRAAPSRPPASPPRPRRGTGWPPRRGRARRRRRPPRRGPPGPARA